jgi:hypothetical protein
LALACAANAAALAGVELIDEIDNTASCWLS